MSESLSASPESDASGLPSGSRYAKAAEWERHRATITELYRDRGMHLDEVISVMAREHNFHANHRMYKTRIKKWGIDKNQKAWEVATMLRLKRERAAIGKETEFTVRGRKVDWAKIEQYLKREPVLTRLPANDERLQLDPTKMADIVCRTPSPEPADESSSSISSSWTTATATATATTTTAAATTTRMSRLTVSRSPAPPPENRLPEEIARLVRDYYTGAIEQGIWVQTSEGSWLPRRGSEASDQLRSWGLKIRNARHLVAIGSVEAGFRAIGACMDEMRLLIRDEDPLLLFHLMGNTLGVTRSGKDLAVEICKYISSLARIILGPKHPVSLIFGRLERVIGTELHLGSLPRIIGIIRDVLASLGGRMDRHNQMLYDRFLQLAAQWPPAHQPLFPADDGPNIRQVIDILEESRNIRVSLPFAFTYLHYLCGLLNSPTTAPGNGGVGVGVGGGFVAASAAAAAAAAASAAATAVAAGSRHRSPSPSLSSTSSSMGGGSGLPRDHPSVRFRESKHFYIFNTEPLSAAAPPDDREEVPGVLWEVDARDEEARGALIHREITSRSPIEGSEGDNTTTTLADTLMMDLAAGTVGHHHQAFPIPGIWVEQAD